MKNAVNQKTRGWRAWIGINIMSVKAAKPATGIWELAAYYVQHCSSILHAAVLSGL